MRNPIPFFLLPVLLLTCGAEEFEKISIETVPQMSPNPVQSSYQSYPLRIRNKTRNPVEIAIILNKTEKYSKSARRAVQLPPNGIQNVELYFPAVNYNWYWGELNLNLYIDGKFQKNDLFLKSETNYSRTDTLFSSQNLMDDYQGLTLYHSSNQPMTSAIPVAQWSRRLHDYIGLKQLYLTGSDRIPAEVEKTMLDWVHLGGTLVICIEPDAPWPEKLPGEKDGFYRETIGWGQKITCRPIRKNEVETVKEYLQENSAGKRGTFRGFGSSNKKDTKSSPLKNKAAEQLRSLQKTSNLMIDPPNAFQSQLLPKIKDIPLQKLFFVMLVFVLLIGPVNYFWLRKYRKEPWILVTTPVISLIFCLLVILFITINEGWHSRGKAFGITLLDQANQIAATNSWTILYAPVAPRGGLLFETEDCLNFSSNGNITVSESSGQHYASDIIQPRVPLFFAMRRTERRRERIRVTESRPEQLTIVNGLGANLTAIAAVGKNGGIFQSAAPVEAGSRTVLNCGKQSSLKKSFDSSQVQTECVDSFTSSDFNPLRIARKLPPGYYAAWTDKPVFFTTGTVPDEFTVHQLIIGTFNLTGDGKDAN